MGKVVVLVKATRYDYSSSPRVLYTAWTTVGTIRLTTAICFHLDSPVLLALLYMGQPSWKTHGLVKITKEHVFGSKPDRWDHAFSEHAEP